MKTVFLIVGKTGSGKDTIVNELIKNNKYSKLVSYATRPKRVGEADNNHIFITADEVDKYKDGMIAYTKIGEYEYFATYDQLKDSDFYIIDYEGVKYLRKCPLIKSDEVRFVTIYIRLDFATRYDRATKHRKDEASVFWTRCYSETPQFEEMNKAEDWDYVITNNNLNTAVDIVKRIVSAERALDV